MFQGPLFNPCDAAESDKYTSSRMILAGLSSIVLIEIYTSVMQLIFQDTDNKVGKAFA